MLEATLPTTLLVITTAAIDSINPCAIGVLILMLSVLFVSKKTNKQILGLGLLYIGAVYVVYFVAGIGLLYGIASIPLSAAEYVSMVVGVLIIGAGIIEIKDYFWYGRGYTLAIPIKFSKKIQEFSTRATVPGVIFLGAFVSAVELPCTGAPYLAIIIVLSQYFDFTAFMLLALYNIIFVAPLLIILVLVLTGKKLQNIKMWKQASRGNMRLAAGLTMVLLGWLLILIANGIINLG